MSTLNESEKMIVKDEDKISKIINICIDIEKKVKAENGFEDYGRNNIDCDLSVLKKSERKEIARKLFEIIPFDLWIFDYGNNYSFYSTIQIKNSKYDFSLYLNTAEYSGEDFDDLEELEEKYFINNVIRVSYFLDSDKSLDSHLYE